MSYVDDDETGDRHMMFTCPSCAARDRRVMPHESTPSPEDTEGTYMFLQRHLERAVRMEIWDAGLGAERAVQVPAHDLFIERGLCSSALAGLRWPGANRLQRKHFSSTFYGLVWDLCRATEQGSSVTRGGLTITIPQGKPHLPTIAAQFEALRYGEKRAVLKQLRRLDSPFQAVICDEKSISRILELAWQRDLYASAQCLTAMMGCGHPIIGSVGFDDPSTDARTNIRARLLDMLTTLESGPEGDPVLESIERVVEENSGDTSSAAQKARAAKFQAHRDIVYQATAVVGWLKRDDSAQALVDARERIGKYIARIDAVRDGLYEIWQRLAPRDAADKAMP
jgi:hypothetical protein